VPQFSTPFQIKLFVVLLESSLLLGNFIESLPTFTRHIFFFHFNPECKKSIQDCFLFLLHIQFRLCNLYKWNNQERKGWIDGFFFIESIQSIKKMQKNVEKQYKKVFYGSIVCIVVSL
jgi:hypothetical protein